MRVLLERVMTQNAGAALRQREPLSQGLRRDGKRPQGGQSLRGVHAPRSMSVCLCVSRSTKGAHNACVLNRGCWGGLPAGGTPQLWTDHRQTERATGRHCCGRIDARGDFGVYLSAAQYAAMAMKIGTAARLEPPARPLRAISPNITKRKAAAAAAQPRPKRCAPACARPAGILGPDLCTGRGSSLNPSPSFHYGFPADLSITLDSGPPPGIAATQNSNEDRTNDWQIGIKCRFLHAKWDQVYPIGLADGIFCLARTDLASERFQPGCQNATFFLMAHALLPCEATAQQPASCQEDAYESRKKSWT
jgi:hypothetical protein